MTKPPILLVGNNFCDNSAKYSNCLQRSRQPGAALPRR